LQFHRYEWFCDAPHNTGSVKVFPSESEFKEHLQFDHDDLFEKSQLPFLVARGKRQSLFPFKVCPFCNHPELDLRNLNVYEMKDNKYKHLEESNKLQKHIGLHIQNFSLWAFLEPDDEDNDETRDAITTVSERDRSDSSREASGFNSEGRGSDLNSEELG